MISNNKSEVIKYLRTNNFREMPDGSYEKIDLLEKNMIHYSFFDDHYQVKKYTFNNHLKSVQSYYFKK